MQKTLLKSALIGGLVVFLWSMFSWMVFPWHQSCMKKFSNEAEVASVIRDNAPTPGIYVLPNTCAYKEGTSQHEITRGMDMMEKGPFMFASVQPHGMGKMGPGPFIISLVTQFIGAFIAAWMLMQTKGLTHKQQIGFVTVFGLGVGVLGMLPAWNWWGFSGCYTIVGIIDLVISWFLAGVAMSRILKR